jgi:hypothetical protein
MNIDQWTDKCKEKLQQYQNDLVVIENSINVKDNEIQMLLQRKVGLQAVIRNMSELVTDLEDEKKLDKK